MPTYTDPQENEYSVTIKAKRIVSDVQTTPEYQEDDSSAIYQMLKNLEPIDFSYYLKRYLYRAAGYRESFEQVPLDDYILTMTEAFSARGVPVSMTPASTRPKAAFKKWLTQKVVSRETVILLGFGLDMSLEDIHAFLTKALQENTLNPKDPVETVCWYCVKNHLGYYHFRRLLSAYEALPGSADTGREISRTGTSILRTEVNDIQDEKSLMKYLNQMRRIDGRSKQSVEARSLFMRMYDEARELIAGLYNHTEEDRTEVMLDRLKDQLSRNDRLYEEQKAEQIASFSERKRKWAKEDITPVDFEEVLFAAVPKDRNGNLLPMKQSALNEQFKGKRLNRQHIQNVIDGSAPISRYDLATMSFFVISQKMDPEASGSRRRQVFIDDTNAMLDRCGMGQLYEANPYEAFLMICMLTDYPLGTYADVWEYSYEEE